MNKRAKKAAEQPVLYRQGDVLVQRIDAIPEDATVLPRDRAHGVVLAHGEATGHMHRIRRRARMLSRADERFIVVLRGGAELTHEEHDTVRLPAGNYRVQIQREYHPEAIRVVQD